MWVGRWFNRTSLRTLWTPIKRWSSSGKQLATLEAGPLPSEVAGIEMEKHVLPFNNHKITCDPSQMNEERKRIGNYAVVLVRKVLEAAAQVEEIEKPSVEEKDGGSEQFYSVSTYCRVKYHSNHIDLEGMHSVRVTNFIPQTPPAEPEQVQIIDEAAADEDMEGDSEEAEATGGKDQMPLPSVLMGRAGRRPNLKVHKVAVRELGDLPFSVSHRIEIKLKYLIESYKAFFDKNTFSFVLFNPNEAIKNVYRIAQQMSNDNLKVREVQAILEEREIESKMDLIQNLINKTQDWKNIYQHLQKLAENNLKNKKFFEYYSEILKIAKQTIDGKKGKQLFLERVTNDFNERKPPKSVKEVFEQEKEKYMQMEETSVEAGVIKKYLEDLSRIPYGIASPETYDLEWARTALDQQHYGMEEVKEAILEMMAVGKLKGSLKGKIICLTGGPGVGKTTIARSMAKALKRQFYNISLGGVSDSSVLKGHRRTYVAAYAGKIVEALKHCQTNNPVILLDEIDKMGSGSQGDPRSELLQILDPNQNESFVDNYLDVAIDLSSVLFICSANYPRNISRPLLDRMEQIKLTSYTDQEKTEIFRRHLLPRALSKSGVTSQQVRIGDGVIDALISEYSRGEPGVRWIERNTLSILEKVALKVVEGEAVPVEVTPDALPTYLGSSYLKKRDHSSLPVGTAISLAGGDHFSRLTHIESFRKSFVSGPPQQRGVMFTGSLGDVFKEAMSISYTFARKFLLSLPNSNTFLFRHQVHIHAPDGASKKDGSTDSLTIAASLASLATGSPVKSKVGLTGELTLSGAILRTSGIKEKVLLAKREGLSEVVMPVGNRRDVDMLQEYIKEGITFHYVDHFRQVYELLFDLPPQAQVQSASHRDKDVI